MRGDGRRSAEQSTTGRQNGGREGELSATPSPGGSFVWLFAQYVGIGEDAHLRHLCPRPHLRPQSHLTHCRAHTFIMVASISKRRSKAERARGDKARPQWSQRSRVCMPGLPYICYTGRREPWTARAKLEKVGNRLESWLLLWNVPLRIEQMVACLREMTLQEWSANEELGPLCLDGTSGRHGFPAKRESFRKLTEVPIAPRRTRVSS